MKEWLIIIFGAGFLILMGMEGVRSTNEHASSSRAKDAHRAAKICSFEKGRFVYRNDKGNIIFKNKVILPAKLAKEKGYCQ